MSSIRQAPIEDKTIAMEKLVRVFESIMDDNYAKGYTAGYAAGYYAAKIRFTQSQQSKDNK